MKDTSPYISPDELPQDEINRDRISLQTNPTMQSLCTVISSMSPDTFSIVEEIKQLPNYAQTRRNYRRLKGLYSEMFLSQALRKFTAIDERLLLDPLQSISSTTNYQFKRDGSDLGNYIVYKNDSKKILAEYDEVCIADGLPVLWEVKTGTLNELNEAIYPDNWMRRLTPLQEAFQTTNFGYAVVTYRENIKPDNPLQRKFKTAGGIIIPIIYSPMQLSREVDVAINFLGL